MCRELEHVSDAEWTMVKAKVETTSITVEDLKIRLARWGGGLTALLTLISLIGGVLTYNVITLVGTVRDNRESNIRAEAKTIEIENAWRNLDRDLSQASVDREGIKQLVESKTAERYTVSSAKADHAETRTWLRENLEAQSKLNELYRLQLTKEIETIKLELQSIQKALKP